MSAGTRIERQVRTFEFQIANGASLSNAVNIEGLALLALKLPAAWTAAALTFEGSVDGAAFGPVHDDAGTEITIASAAVVANRIVVNAAVLEKLAALVAIKLRSGTAAAPVNQGADRIIKLVGKG